MPGALSSGADAHSIQAHAQPLCRGADGGDPEAPFAAAYAACGDRWCAAGTDAVDAGLSVRAALPLCAGTLSERGAETRWHCGGTPIRLLVAARRASTSERVMAGSGSAQLRPEPMLLSVEHLVVEFGAGAYRVRAVSDVSFDLKRGETLGLVGESGCGKSTLARAVLQLLRPTSGKVVFDGADLARETGERLRRLRRRAQLIFQDPIASLNPRRRIGDIVAEALVIAGVSDRNERETRVRNVLRAVGLDLASSCAGDHTSSPAANANAFPLPERWCSSPS